MPSQRPISATATRGRAGLSAQPGPDSSPDRPPIWIEGRQAPRFEAKTYARAGTLISRQAGARMLAGLSDRSAALSGYFAARDWSEFAGRLGRAGRLLPSAEGMARATGDLSRCAGEAQQILFDLGAAAGEEPPGAGPAVAQDAGRTPAPGAAEPPVANRGAAALEPRVSYRGAPPVAPAHSEEDDLSAIRAMMAADRLLEAETRGKAGRKRKARKDAPEIPEETRRLPAPLARAGGWACVRLLASGAFLLAAPFGFGRALWRHLDGADLREVVAELEELLKRGLRNGGLRNGGLRNGDLHNGDRRTN